VKRLIILIAVCFVDMVGLMIVAPLMPFYALKFHAQEWMVGWLISAFAMAQLVSSPLWGRISDRYGRRPALLVGLVAAGIAYLVFGFATSVTVLFLSRMVQGLGGGTTGVAQAYVADAMEPSERAKALGWLSAGTSLGVIVGPPLGSLAYQIGPATPGIVAAVLVFINAAFAWYWLPESRHKYSMPNQTVTRSPRSVQETLWEIVSHPTRPAPRVIWIYVVGMLALNALIGVMAIYLKDTFGVTEKNIGYIFMAFGVVGVVMRTAPVGWINARLGEVRTMRLGAALVCLGLALMPLPGFLPGFVLCLMLVPTGTALLFPASTSLVSQRTERAEMGQVMGAQQTLRGIVSIIGPIGATAVYQAFGHSLPFIGAAVVVAVALLLASREPHAVPEPATIKA
jgi:multidrug resistance protein